MKKLKVYGGLVMEGRNQKRTIVAATSQKRAMELLKSKGHPFSAYEFRGWWGETKNNIELATATEEGVWVSTDNFAMKFERR